MDSEAKKDPAPAPTDGLGPVKAQGEIAPAVSEVHPVAPARKRILIVDDEIPFTRMVKLNLEKTGAFEVRAENRAAGAVAAAREFKPDLIILDVIMPGIDGGDVQAQIKRDRALRNTPIIFLTATVSKREAGEDGLNSGGDLFLAKPVSVEHLVARINEHLVPITPSEEKKP